MHRPAQLDAPDVEVTDFAGLEIGWDRRVLRPRPWTAEQGQWAADLLRDAPQGPILDLCCGAGHVGLLTACRSGRELVQVDEDPAATAYARKNADAAGVRSDVRTGPIGSSLRPDEQFPMVIADPPWLPMVDDVAYPEDPVAPTADGIEVVDALHQCVDVGLRHLLSEGHLVLQVGLARQIDRVAGWVSEHSRSGSTPGRSVLGVRDRRPGGYLVHVGPSGSTA